MNILALLVVLSIGQCECFPVYIYTPPVPMVAPVPVIYYNIGEVERARFYDDVHYPKRNEYLRVPIINGYAPAITKGNFVDGSPYLIYNYKDKIPYDAVMTLERRRQKDQKEREERLRALVPVTPVAPEPQVSPLPQVTPVAPEPQVSPLPVKESVVEPRPLAPSLSTSGPMRKPSEVGTPERIITPGYNRQD